MRAAALATGVIALLLCGGTVGAAVAVVPANATGGFVRPVDGARITQAFGCTSFALEPADVHCPGGHRHSGVDLAAAMGTPVRATLGGVAQVVVDATGFGLHVIIDHGGGLSSLYGHLSSVAVSSGDVVAAGQVIGAVGSSGNSTGPHLHFEIRRDGIPEDPLTDLRLP
ncbi:MAG: M23 family metallopeptidase [Candidatus Dormibacteraeota bacterium]|nr:M23 family metallopeptidase [Candidatus Dormibacteraeota bacterium]MBV9524739.1 M23 family metallopeptidase [Candidatus Dormibacteraeota bacterium]